MQVKYWHVTTSTMGSRDWLKNIISLKKVKNDKAKKLKGSSASVMSNEFILEDQSQKESINFTNGVADEKPNMPDEDIAATRIQTAFRAYMARKTFRHMKGIIRLQSLIQGHSVKKQATSTLSHLHSWSRIQAQIRTRRVCMVTEGRIRQKKLENQLKLEAKLHDLEVEWSGGFETMETVLARIQNREDAAVKRERAMAYAFSHQWRANSNPNLGLNASELAKANWGWSWMERWIAARPWESRVLVKSSPKKADTQAAIKTPGKNLKSPTMKKSNSLKSSSPNAKVTTKARRLSYGAPEKVTPQRGNTRVEENSTKKGQLPTL